MKSRTIGSKRSKGAWLAASAAVLFAGGVACGSNGGDVAKVQCHGANDCKGQSECATDHSDCTGLNSCKGKGWVHLTAEMCTEKGGTPG